MHKSLTLILVFYISILLAFPGHADVEDVTGLWTTVDDKSGKPRSVVRLYLEQGKLYGDIVKIYFRPGEAPDPVCDLCPHQDPRYGKKIIGMTILSGMEKKPGKKKWQGGKILDPENGKEYRCSLWLEDGKLRVRGHLLFLFRTQQWLRAEE